jgi:hypothetical protein
MFIKIKGVLLMVDFFDLKKELILCGKKYKRHQFVIPTLKRLQHGRGEFVSIR